MKGNVASALMRRHTSKPSSFGIMTSSRIASGFSERGKGQGFLTIARRQQRIALARQPRLEDGAVVIVVVGDQDQRGVAHGVLMTGTSARARADRAD